MSTTTEFITELVRAANEIEKLGDFEKRRLLNRASLTIREMREAAGVPNSHTTADGLIDLMVAAVELGRGRRTNDQTQKSMLDAAAMIRDLRIALDTRTEIRTRDASS